MAWNGGGTGAGAGCGGGEGRGRAAVAGRGGPVAVLGVVRNVGLGRAGAVVGGFFFETTVVGG